MKVHLSPAEFETDVAGTSDAFGELQRRRGKVKPSFNHNQLIGGTDKSQNVWGYVSASCRNKFYGVSEWQIPCHVAENGRDR